MRMTNEIRRWRATVFDFYADYFINSTIHGLHFLAEGERHWTEKLFWSLCVITSSVACFWQINLYYLNYKINPISFGAETTYLNWHTKFPAVIVCESENLTRISALNDERYGNPHNFNFDEVVKEIAFFRGVAYYTSKLCLTDRPDPFCPTTNLLSFATTFRYACADIFVKCTWMGVAFDCCATFKLFRTEVGPCYAFNSMQTATDKNTTSFVSNRNVGVGHLFVQIQSLATVYVLNEEEVPSLTSLSNEMVVVAANTHYKRRIAIREIQNDKSVRNVDIKYRKCRFTDENPLNVYKHYSYSACCVECRKRAQLRTCGCNQHFMPGTDESDHCDLKGIGCLEKNFDNLNILQAKWSRRNALYCDCLPSCSESEITVVQNEEKSINESSIVEIILEMLPSDRYKRSIIRDELDLIVSMGGMVALFLGASLLSVVEFVYYTLIRTRR